MEAQRVGLDDPCMEIIGSRIEGRGPIKSARNADGPKSECWPRVWMEETQKGRGMYLFKGTGDVIPCT